MAKLKNLFIGCPVQVKQCTLYTGVVADVDMSDGTAWVSFPTQDDQDDGWFDIEDLKLAPFPEPEKVVDHLEKFW